MNRRDVENSILSAFFFCNDVGDDLSDIYTLDISAFTSKSRKRTAERLNAVKDGAYGFESYLIEEKSQGTVFEQDYMDIISQRGFTLKESKKYHDKLVEESRMEEVL